MTSLAEVRKLADEIAPGVEAGFAWGDVIDKVAIYMDYGVTAGMRKGMARWAKQGMEIEERTIGKVTHKIAADFEAAWDMQRLDYRPHGWIQWKGTDVCMDVHCVCGELAHVDDDGTYHVKCQSCGRVYFCNGHIELIELQKEPENCVKLARTDGGG